MKKKLSACVVVRVVYCLPEKTAVISSGLATVKQLAEFINADLKKKLEKGKAVTIEKKLQNNYKRLTLIVPITL